MGESCYRDAACTGAGVDPASKNIMKHQPVKSGTLFEKDLVHRVITQGGLCGGDDDLRLLDRCGDERSYGRSDNGVLRAGALTDAALSISVRIRSRSGSEKKASILG